MTPQEIRLEDYRPPPWLVPKAVLDVNLEEGFARVSTLLHFRRSPDSDGTLPALCLNGVGLRLHHLSLDGRPLEEDEYSVDHEILRILHPPPSGRLKTVVDIRPDENSSLQGLYRSDEVLCTQNEAEGFRRITYFPDRPDILCVFTITLRASKDGYPRLLANGNPASSGSLPGGRHFATWHDPVPKPCYLVAMVAGEFGLVEDAHITHTGKKVALSIFVPQGEESKARHAMESLKRVMAWDEEVYGFTYDLDIFMIVAVDSFNGGAMENTGLNIFSTSLLLADPESATDEDYLMVERVVAHEYLHHWTGNRISCRDWFQLTLKEGLTVFRDEQYISTRTSPEGFRIDAARRIVENQFPEDDGPLAHPVRPARYRSIDNFYTQTVYQKGKELIRMLEILVGRENFRRGMSRYAREWSGRPVTVEDFLTALSTESQTDLSSFLPWYRRAGVPEIALSGEYDEDAGTYELKVRQTCRPASDDAVKKPLCIPLSIGLVDARGRDIPWEEATGAGDGKRGLLRFQDEERSFILTGIDSEPVPSLFRDFSAPVRWDFPYDPEYLSFLINRDPNPFARWNAAQRLATHILVDIADRTANGERALPSESDLDLFLSLFDRLRDNPGLLRRMLDFPPVKTIVRLTQTFRPSVAAAVRREFRRSLALRGESILTQCRGRLAGKLYTRDAAAVEQRGLKNLCLSLLVPLGEKYRNIALEQFQSSDNMTDTLAALSALSHESDEFRHRAYAAFARRWAHHPRILDKWFALRAASREMEGEGALENLANHPGFNPRRPAALNALYGGFTANLSAFHRADGAGYRALADRILSLDSASPAIAARLAKGFGDFPLLEPEAHNLMESQIHRLHRDITPSPQLGEVIHHLIQPPTQSDTKYPDRGSSRVDSAGVSESTIQRGSKL